MITSVPRGDDGRRAVAIAPLRCRSRLEAIRLAVLDVVVRARKGTRVPCLGVEAPARRGARSAHTGRMYATSNEARRDASAVRHGTLIPFRVLRSERLTRLEFGAAAAMSVPLRRDGPHALAMRDYVEGKTTGEHCRIHSVNERNG